MLLARTVTTSTVEECKQRMSLAEFRHWRALYRIEPWGDEWSQARAIAASNLAPWNKETASNLPKFFPVPQKKTATETEQMMAAFAKRHNTRVERERRKGAQQRLP